MHPASVRCLALVIFVLCVQCAAGADTTRPATRPTEEKSLYDDGSLHFHVPLNAKGKRNGQFLAFYKGGKKIQQRVRYENGERTGTRLLYDQKGQVVAEELWIHDKLVNPKSMRLIEAERAQLLKEATTLIAKMPTFSNSHSPTRDSLAHALAKLNMARYLADLPADVTLDDEYINLTQYASELLVVVGHLTHTPEMPSGFDQKAYELGRNGCGRSNIFESSRGGDATRSIEAYLDDSDPSNIDRLGHRRWILNPSMAKTGFGESGKFSAMYSMDRSRETPPDYDLICYPPRGLCPLNMFAPNWAWSVTVNPREYKVRDDATLEIFPVDAQLKRASQPVPLEYSHVDHGGYGVSNVIIARPNSAVVVPGVGYEVVVHGVETEEGKAAELSYYVNFYNAADR